MFNFDTRDVENDDSVVETINNFVSSSNVLITFHAAGLFLEGANSSKKLGSSSTPSKALQPKVLSYFFNFRSCECCFTIVSSVSDPNYAACIRCRCVKEDFRRIRDIIGAKMFSSFGKDITSFSRQKGTPLTILRTKHKSCETVQPLFQEKHYTKRKYSMCSTKGNGEGGLQ